LNEPELAVRLAALKALQRMGNAFTAALLVRHAAINRGVEQTAARTALWHLADPQVDQTLVTALSQEKEAAVLQEVIQAVAERRIMQGKALVFEKMMDPNPQIRIQAFRALRVLSGPEDVPRLIERLLAAEDVAEQGELATTAAAAARKIGRPDDRADLVVNKLRGTENPNQQKALILVLGKIGDDSSLSEVRRALVDDDPAVREAAGRALTEWPTSTAKDDVFWLAKNSDHPTLQVLAVRAYVRMVGLDRFRRPEAAVNALRAVLPWARRPEERMAVLGVLPLFPSREALTLAESFLSDASVQEEARVAVERLRRSLQ
jgi:HEAT repeat protein